MNHIDMINAAKRTDDTSWTKEAGIQLGDDVYSRADGSRWTVVRKFRNMLILANYNETGGSQRIYSGADLEERFSPESSNY